MASQPAQPTRQASSPSSQRQSSPEQLPQTQSSPSLSAVRTRSEDSQTLFLNKTESADHSNPTIVTAEQEQLQEQEEQQRSQPTQPSPTPEEPQKCWICFSDSTEDTPTTSPWRNPCPCALVAHEECLLDWIADMESPTNTRRGHGALMAPPKIECPQCKAEIKLARPRNLIVEGVRGMERLGSQLITPGALTVLFGTVYHSSMAWGVHSVYAVFGAEDGFTILRPLILNTVRPPLELNTGNSTPKEIGEAILAVAVNHLVHWRLYVGLPLITPMLVLSRTTLADSVLPVLPILFFATQQTFAPNEPLDFGSWPPSASLAFAILPYIRSVYNIYHRKVWAEKEKRWLKEIQPRVREQAANEGGAGEGAGEGGEGGMGAREDDDNVFEVRIDGGIWEDWESGDDEDEAPQPNQPNNAPPNAQPHQEDNNQAQQGQNNEQQQPPQPAEEAQPNRPAAANAGGNQQNERRLSFSPTAIAETVLGALLFPAIAGLSGELLKLALPKTWTTTSPSTSSIVGLRGGSRVAAKGLLQEKWGRSLVGGCLFVVFKDAVMLYVRWKMVQMHRRRRVLDWEGRRGKKAAS